MKIVIAGAGAVGYSLAELLSLENQDITLIDDNEEVLSYAANHLDVLTIKGDATSVEILEEAEVEKAELVIAVTTLEANNLLTAIMAKQFGAKRTIARVTNIEFLQPKQKAQFVNVGVDVLISPEQLAAQEINRLLERATTTDYYEFEDGKLAVVGFMLDAKCPILNLTLTQVNDMNPDFEFRGLLIMRDGISFIPQSTTRLQKGDHIFLSVHSNSLDKATQLAGKKSRDIKKVMIIGHSPLAVKTAKLLEEKFQISIVMDNKAIERQCVELFEDALILHADASNTNILKQEGLESMDAFIALTPNSETNIIASLTAEQAGVYKTIALVDNVDYIPLSQNIGIDTIINMKLIAANNIFRFVRKGHVEAIAGLHGVDAELIEFVIDKNSKLTKHPIRKQRLPAASIVAGVVRGDQCIIPDGSFTFEIHDRVIVLVLPQAISRVEKIFK